MEATPSPSPLKVLGWALYLGCSWTWCIGMFLPVLLVRDFGPSSFFVFAVPNVLGAMLMGLVLAGPGASEGFVAKHRAACGWFSAVTLAFQVFFLVWMVKGALPSSLNWVLAGALPVVLLLRSYRSGWAAFVAVLVFLTSALSFAAWSRTSPTMPAAVAPQLPSGGLVWLAAVSLFGFALCPYLDLTFHAARQRLPGRPGSIAFVLGFGVFFFAMILGTFAYAGPLIQRALDARLPVQPGLLAAPLLLHISAQLGYSGKLHADALSTHVPGNWEDARPLWAAAAGVMLGLLSGPTLDPELVYRCFMSFYGLAFPAYVWVCAVKRERVTPRMLTVFAGAVAIAAPMFWMASIERQTWWFGPGLLVVLLSRLLVRPGSSPLARTAPAPPGSP